MHSREQAGECAHHIRSYVIYPDDDRPTDRPNGRRMGRLLRLVAAAIAVVAIQPVAPVWIGFPTSSTTTTRTVAWTPTVQPRQFYQPTTRRMPTSYKRSRIAVPNRRRTSGRQFLAWEPMESSSQKTPTANDKDDTFVVRVALTREAGKNDALAHVLQQSFSTFSSVPQQQYRVQLCELPCIAHAPGPDADRLATASFAAAAAAHWSSDPPTTEDAATAAAAGHWDCIVVTSPEAARVLASVWNAAQPPGDGGTPSEETAAAVATEQHQQQYPLPFVAAVGKATEQALAQAGIPVAFVPSKATAEVLVQELPFFKTTTTTTSKPTVLYPASAKAAATVEDGLTRRGFTVTRWNTYDTVAAHWTEEECKVAAECQIACFASPSAIKGWLANQNTNNKGKFNNKNDTNGSSFNSNVIVLAACIGETSAGACRKLGWTNESIFYPKDSPGMEGWVQAIQDAVAMVLTNRQKGQLEGIEEDSSMLSAESNVKSGVVSKLDAS